MANKQLILENAARDLGGGQLFDIILIDGGTSYTMYVRDQSQPPTQPAIASAITSAGAVPVIAPSGGGDVVGTGTTGKLLVWVDGPASVAGDSLLAQSAGSIIQATGNLTLTAGNLTLTAGNLVLTAGQISFPDDVRQTFNPGATVAGLNVGAQDGEPSTLVNGDLFYDSIANQLKARINGATVTLGGGSITIGSTVISGGTTTRLLYDNAGVVGEVSGFTSDGTNVTAGSGNLRATSPRITTAIADANGNAIISFNPVASAVDRIQVTNAATANPATVDVAAVGTDSNIHLSLTPKGTGAVIVPGSVNLVLGPVSSSGIALRNESNGRLLVVRPDDTTKWQSFYASDGRFAGANSAFNEEIILAASSSYIGIYSATATKPAIRFTNTANAENGQDSGLARQAAKVVRFTDGTDAGYGWGQWAGQSRVSAQFNKTSDTTLANVTGLSVTLQAGRTYSFEAVLYTVSDAGGGVKFAIGGTATATAIIYEAVVNQGGLDLATGTQRAAALATAVGDITAVTTAYCRITGTITVNAAGTLTVQFAQNASSGVASSVLVGSTFIVNDTP